MFDSATLMRLEKENPFKGSKDLNRTSNNRFNNPQYNALINSVPSNNIRVEMNYEQDNNLPKSVADL